MYTSGTIFRFANIGAGSLLLSLLMIVTACGTSQQTTDSSSPEIRLTALDSTSGTPLDSAWAWNRTAKDTLRTDSLGRFALKDVEPALLLFDVGGYGYHRKRHVSVLFEPQDTSVYSQVHLRPELLRVNCQNVRSFYRDNLRNKYQQDTTNVRAQLIDVFARNGRVRVQPVVVNDLSTTIFIPDNFGALGHFDVRLYDENQNRLSYTYENAPPDNGHRIYSRGDVLPVVPDETERLSESTLILDEPVEKGTGIYAKLQYTFSRDDTLRATSVTSFPDVNLDSLQTPVYDTLRVDGRVRAPDSLVAQRDTSVMRIVGIDTTVTRNDYLLYSTYRDTNAVSSAREATSLLYVPDSVKARARRDSLEALAEERSEKTRTRSLDSLDEDRAPLRIVRRTDSTQLSEVLTDPRLLDVLAEGLPAPGVEIDSLLALPDSLRHNALSRTTLTHAELRRGIDHPPAAPLPSDSAFLSVPSADSFYAAYGLDSLAGPAQVRPQPRPDSIPFDSLRLTVPPSADSVVVDSVVAAYASSPPPSSYWYVPASYTRGDERILVLDPSFYRLRAQASVDTTVSVSMRSFATFIPDRVGSRDETEVRRLPQQILAVPRGTYRSKYLERWRAVQQKNFQETYCEIFPFPLETQWRSTSMH